MTDTAWLWLTLVLIGSTTMLTRGSFIIPGERARLPPVVQRVLRYAPAAALAALIAPDLLMDNGVIDPLNPKLLAGALVVAIALRSRNPWLPFVLGMGSLLLMRKWLGW